MKNYLRKIEMLLCLFVTIFIFSNFQPPVPMAKTAAGSYDCNCDGTIDDFDTCNVAPPPCDTVPIDQNLTLILITGLLFGSYMIYRYNQKQKTPLS